MNRKRRQIANLRAEALLAEIMPQLDDWMSTQWTAPLRGYDCTIGRTIAFVIAAAEIVGRSRSVRTLLPAIRRNLDDRHLVEALADAARHYATSVIHGFDTAADQNYRHADAIVTYSPGGHRIVVHSQKATISIRPSRLGERKFTDADGALVADIYRDAIRRETGEDGIAVRLARTDASGGRAIPADGRGPLPACEVETSFPSMYMVIVDGTELLLVNEGHHDDPHWAKWIDGSVVESAPLERLRLDASGMGRQIAHVRDVLPGGRRLAATLMLATRAAIKEAGGPAAATDMRVWLDANHDAKPELRVKSHVATYNPRTFGWMRVPVAFKIAGSDDLATMVGETYGSIAAEAAATLRRTGRPPVDIDVVDPDLTPYRIERPLVAYMHSIGLDVAREVTALVAAGSAQRRIKDAMLHLKDGVVGGSFEIAPGVHWRRGNIRLEGVELPESAAVSHIGGSIDRLVRHDMLSSEMTVTRTLTKRHASVTVTRVHLANVRCPVPASPTDGSDRE